MSKDFIPEQLQYRSEAQDLPRYKNLQVTLANNATASIPPTTNKYNNNKT
jgi:hypothetical protein